MASLLCCYLREIEPFNTNTMPNPTFKFLYCIESLCMDMLTHTNELQRKYVHIKCLLEEIAIIWSINSLSCDEMLTYQRTLTTNYGIGILMSLSVGWQHVFLFDDEVHSHRFISNFFSFPSKTYDMLIKWSSEKMHTLQVFALI